MQVRQTRLVDFLGEPDVQLVVPVYQRVYSWTRPQLRAFWDDVMEAGRLDRPHFMGMVFFAEERSHHAGVRQLDLIDGQQRMTTMTLLMCAVRTYLSRTGATLDGLDADGVARKFLKLDAGGDSEDGGEGADEGPGDGSRDGAACKLVLSRADAPTLRWIEGMGMRPATDEEYSKLVVEAYEWFVARMDAEGFDFATFARGIAHLYIVEVMMGPSDRRQTVFESLNAKGLPLSTPDLVRNFLLMRSEFDDRSYLYDTYWAKVEDAFSTDADDRYLAHAIRIWTGSGAAIKDDRGIFDAFKASFSGKDRDELERRTAGLAAYCIDFHEKVLAGDEATIEACREWEEGRGKAERLRNNRRIFGD